MKARFSLDPEISIGLPLSVATFLNPQRGGGGRGVGIYPARPGSVEVNLKKSKTCVSGDR